MLSISISNHFPPSFGRFKIQGVPPYFPTFASPSGRCRRFQHLLVSLQIMTMKSILVLLTICLAAVAFLFLLTNNSQPPNLEVAATRYAKASLSPSSSLSSTPSTTEMTTLSTLSTIRHACLVHVGKTAGTLLSCVLGFKLNKCGPSNEELWKKRQDVKSMSILPRVVKSRSHLGKHFCSPNTQAFVVSTRDPIARMHSWFYYSKPEDPNSKNSFKNPINAKYLWGDCYPEFEDFVLQGLSHNVNQDTIPHDLANMTCPQRAWAAIMGKRQVCRHEFYNYEYYLHQIHELVNSTRPNNILVLRNEHLSRDWNSLEHLWGDEATNDNVNGNGTLNGDVLFGQKANVNKRKKTVEFSPQILKILCRALCPEIQVYKDVILRAQNLDDEQRALSFDELQDKCPDEGPEIQICPELPEFSKVQGT